MTRTATILIIALLAFPFTALANIAPPQAAQRVQWDAQLSQTTLTQGRSNDVYLNIELDPAELVSTQRVPMNIALVIDKSGSMSGSDKIGYAREAAMSIIDQLEPYDRVSIVAFDSDVDVLLPSTTVNDREWIKGIIARINTGSNTALHGGMVAGADEVLRNYNNEFLNRVIVLSDGIANVGPSSDGELAQAARTLGDRGISVTTMGLGLDYNENAMTGIADAAGGNYYFIESGDQMAYQFQQELFGMMRVAALQPTITIHLGDGVTLHDVYGYDISRDGSKVRVRVGDLIGGRKMTVTAHLTVSAPESEQMGLASLALSYTDAVDGAEVALTRGVVAHLTEDQAVAMASTDMDVGASVQRVRNAQAVTEAMDAYSRGDDAGAEAIVQAAREESVSFNSVAGAAADVTMEDDLDSLMMEMEEAAPSAAGRSSVSKSRKAEARSTSRGQ
jgi:Ca-activated chloride channel homolog